MVAFLYYGLFSNCCKKYIILQNTSLVNIFLCFSKIMCLNYALSLYCFNSFLTKHYNMITKSITNIFQKSIVFFPFHYKGGSISDTPWSKTSTDRNINSWLYWYKCPFRISFGKHFVFQAFGLYSICKKYHLSIFCKVLSVR